MTQTGGPQATALQDTGVAQLLYANVDRVVDGVASSGWQTMETTAGLEDHDADLMRALVDTSLKPVRALPGFPTPQEIASAERRLAQAHTQRGTVIAHTAPAGVDTTGRANTVTHVLLLADLPAPQQATTRLWRSPGWATPFGPEQVRATSLPDPCALVAGDAVDDDTLAGFISAAPRAALLSAMADALEGRLRSRATNPTATEKQERVVAVACESSDEAALWVAALQWTCAPATGRLLGFSTLERLVGSGDLERLAANGIDLVFVPPAELEVAATAGAVVLDPRQPPTQAPATGWGQMVAAVCQDLGAWMAGTQVVREILALLPEHRDLTPGWPLAIAEACNPGLLGDASASPGLVSAVEAELVSCWPQAVSEQPYLAGVVKERILGSQCDRPQQWWDTLAKVSEQSPVDGIVAGMVSKYLIAAQRSREWLQDNERQVPAQVRAVLGRWSAEPGAAQELEQVVPQMLAAVEAQGPDAVARLRLADGLTRSGIALPQRLLTPLLDPVCALLARSAPKDLERVLAVPVSGRTRSQLAARLDVMLSSASAQVPWQLPSLDPRMLAWLAQGLGEMAPMVAAELCGAVLCGKVRVGAEQAASATPQAQGQDQPGEVSLEVVERLVRALGALRQPVSLSPRLVAAMSRALTPQQACGLPALVRERDAVVSAVALEHPEDPYVQQQVAADLLAAGHGDRDLMSRRYERFSALTAARLVARYTQVPALAEQPHPASVLAHNVLVAVAVLEREGRALAHPTLELARDKALAVLVVVLWAGTPVRQIPGRAEATLDQLPQRLEAAPQIVGPVGSRSLGPTLPLVVVRLFWASKNGKYPQDWQASVGQDMDALAAVEGASDPLLSGRDQVALSACRAWAAGLGPQGSASAAEALTAFAHNPPGFNKWISKHIISAADRSGSGLRRIFGAH